MGVLTLSQLRTELLFMLRRRSDTGDNVTPVRLAQWLNWAYEYVTLPNVHRHWELETLVTRSLVANTFEYDLSEAGLGFRVTGVRCGRFVQWPADTYRVPRNKLWPQTPEWFSQRTHTTAERPTNYTIMRNRLVVSPAPTATANVVVLEAWRAPTRLSADADLTVIGAYWDRALLLGARWMAEFDLGYRDLAEQSRIELAAYVNENRDRWLLWAEEEPGWQPEFMLGESVMPESAP